MNRHLYPRELSVHSHIEENRIAFSNSKLKTKQKKMSTVTLRLSQIIRYLPPAFMQWCYSGDMTIVTNINTLFCTVKLHPSWPPQLQPRALRDLEEPSQGEGIHLLHQWSKEHWVCRYTYRFTYSVKWNWSLNTKNLSQKIFTHAAVDYTEFGLCIFFSFCPRIVKLYIPACQD